MEHFNGLIKQKTLIFRILAIKQQNHDNLIYTDMQKVPSSYRIFQLKNINEINEA